MEFISPPLGEEGFFQSRGGFQPIGTSPPLDSAGVGWGEGWTALGGEGRGGVGGSCPLLG